MRFTAPSAATGLFTEATPYAPNSPYSASKASSDHLVRAWRETYGLPTIVTNCSNNYGPFHFPEKLIPLMIIKEPCRRAAAGLRRRAECARLALCGGPCPRAGARARAGQGRRDLQYRRPHRADQHPGGEDDLRSCSTRSSPRPAERGERLITFVPDRPGHDRRYAIDPSKIERELGWRAAETFETGLAKTVRWYVDNRGWWRSILDRGYRTERIGLTHVAEKVART